MVALEIADPKFDLKCRARGLDPVHVRQEVVPQPEKPAGQEGIS
jgi:hypothetical protein